MKKLETMLPELMPQQTNLPCSETTAHLKKKVRCEICQDEGGYMERKKNGYFIRGEEIEQDYWVRCACLKTQQQTNRLKQSSVLIASQNYTFDQFSTASAKPIAGMKQLATLYMREFPSIRMQRQNSIALLGQSGCGKTHLLIALLNVLIESGEQVKYCTYTELLEQIARDQFAHAAAVMESYRTAPILVLDDVFKPIGGRAQVKAWEALKLFDLINYRYMHQLPILFSSELTFDELFSVDEAIASRLFEMTQHYIWTVPKNRAHNFRLHMMRGSQHD